MACTFCSIAAKEIPSDIIYEDERFVVFKDIHPKAPFHVLVIPKEHIVSLIEAKQDHSALMGDMVFLAKKVAEDKGFNGYKLLMNVGKEGGQEVDHIHLHVLASKA
ncbi:MAG: histidine triad nucleotide-binding protein [Patescibacteria group bacterium]|nr:histidine triad nucleotide-binding protein [Patescibacteria group bacterium]